MIGQICHGNLGGSSRVAGRLANALAQRGQCVEMFSLEPLPWALSPDIEVHTLRQDRRAPVLPLYSDWSRDDRDAFAQMLIDQLAETPFDILHYHYAQPFAAILRQVTAALGDRMPVTIGTLHGTDLSRCRSDQGQLASLKDDLAATDEVTTTSNHMCRLFRSLMPDQTAPRILPIFVEDDWPDTASHEETPLETPARPVILHVSNFRTVKDVMRLAQLFGRILEQVDVELWLVGEGPDLPDLKNMLNNSPARHVVRYLGVQDNPTTCFKQASVLLSTSSEEGFGLAVLEAMASGAIVAATKVGGIPELVTDDVTGLLFTPHDIESTAARVASLLKAPAKVAAMRAAALCQAEHFRESQVVGLYQDLYSERLTTRPVHMVN